eukprot:GSChrysophyteH1.ASY1.ANO1.524.1 assembled CDS
MDPIPTVDISSLMASDVSPEKQAKTIAEIGAACHSAGFMYISGAGISPKLTARLEEASQKFFDLPIDQKKKIEMSRGGSAWRGFFAVGDELTSGRADQKEGIYFGVEGDASDPRPLHGINQWPENMPEFREDVIEYLTHMKRISTVIMSAIAEHLYALTKEGADGQAKRDFTSSFAEPTELFRVFGYPAADPTKAPDARDFGVQEHTDYGYITVLYQDNTGGLQVKSPRGDWLDVPPRPGTFVVNLGDALEHHSRGYFKATPHRVLHHRGARNADDERRRVSFPYFFDPNFDHDMAPISDLDRLSSGLQQHIGERSGRWDGEHLLQFRGKYKDYLLKKISKCFPELFNSVVVPALDSPAVSGSLSDSNSVSSGDQTDEYELDEKNAQIRDEVFEWTARQHQNQPLTPEEQEEELALRARMAAWMAENT